METTLHQQLKAHFATCDLECEQRMGTYRIDVLQGDHLIEIQCSSLAGFRDKIRALTPQHQVTIIKPLIRRTRIAQKKWSRITSRRFSPRAGNWLDLFEELVHFVNVFPHENLTLQLLLVDIEEVRCAPKKRRGRSRYHVEDRSLLEIVEIKTIRHAADLFELLPAALPHRFNTADLAEILQKPRWLAQKIAYCLRQTRAVERVGKQGNAWLYQRLTDAECDSVCPQATAARAA